MLIDPLLLALCACAALAGLTGTWSPCGFSMVHTIGPVGHAGGRGTAAAGSATFALGALAGGAATFGVLASLGALAGTGGQVAIGLAAAIAAAAALGELRGVRIVPQVRRQVPEHWRWVMPLPVAAALYGVLLGIGFTTFVLTFAVWALAGIAVALGDPVLGVAIGVAFGAGRALPVCLIAPVVDGPRGARAAQLMAERPMVLRGFRLADGLALAAVAVALVATGPGEEARGQGSTISNATDPTASGSTLAWSGPDGEAVVEHQGERLDIDGRKPAVGGPNVAYLSAPGEVTIIRRTNNALVDVVDAPGADQLAVSGSWLVYRIREPRGDRLVAVRIPSKAQVDRTAEEDAAFDRNRRTIQRARAPRQISRPSLWRSVAVWSVTETRSSRIVERNLAGRRGNRVRRRGRGPVMVSNPTILGRVIAYVRASPTVQDVRLRHRATGREARVARIAQANRRDRGYTAGRSPHEWVRRTYRPYPRSVRRQNIGVGNETMWTLALRDREVLLTRLRQPRGGEPRARIVRVRF